MALQNEAAFSPAEYDARIARVQQAMDALALDVLLVHEIGNVSWLCGIQCVCWNKYFCMAIPRQGKPMLIIQSFERWNARIWTHLPGDQVVEYASCEVGKEDQDPLEVTAEVVRQMAPKHARIGMELSTPCVGFSAAGFKRLRGLLDAVVVDSAMLVEKVRVIKSEAELGYIRQAAYIASNAMNAVMEGAYVGMTDNQLAAIAHRVMAEQGSEYTSLDPIITIGDRSGVPHTSYGRHVIHGGDTGLMELGACICRYSGMTMRSVSFGEPSDDVKFMADGCIASVNAVLEHARPGMRCVDVALAAKAQLKKQLEKYMWHGIYGYSVGLGFPPRWDDCGAVEISEKNQSILQQGMVFHVSTTLRDLGKHSITVSETMEITETGSRALTNVERKLFVR